MRIALLGLATLMIVLSPLTAALAAPSTKLGRVVGRIDCQGVSGCPGIAVLWPADDERIPDPRRFTLVPVSVTPLEADGVFSLSAPAGDYFVGAILRRTTGGMMGPPRVGDMVYMTPDRAGNAVRVQVPAGGTVDVGRQGDPWVFGGMETSADMGVSGIIIDESGVPVPGLLVFAFADPEVTKAPLAVSARSDELGHFVLPLASPGKVYLRARRAYRGGRPEPGDLIGVFGGDKPRPLLISAGRLITGMKIVVRKVPDSMKLKNPPVSARPRIED